MEKTEHEDTLDLVDLPDNLARWANLELKVTRDASARLAYVDPPGPLEREERTDIPENPEKMANPAPKDIQALLASKVNVATMECVDLPDNLERLESLESKAILVHVDIQELVVRMADLVNVDTLE
jgi:hypothetical protein